MNRHTNVQNRIKFITGLVICAQSVAATVQTVVDTSLSSEVVGSLPYILSNISSGDTIHFKIAQRDTLKIVGKLTIDKDVVIDGTNKATGNRISLMNVQLILKNSKISISNLIFLDFLYGYNRVYEVMENSGSSSIVGLAKVDIRGKYVFGNDYWISPAISNHSGATMTLDSVRVQNCPGGGIGNQRGTVTIDHSEFINNRTYNSGKGGGIHNSHGVMTISNSTIDGNNQSAAGYSGSWYAGGGIFNADGIMTIFNSTISNNRVYNKLTWSITNPSAAAYGGGIASYRSPGETFPTICCIFNSTICTNTSYGGSIVKNVNPKSWGGGAYLGLGSYVTNCTFYSDSVQGVVSAGGLTPSSLSLSGPEIYAAATPCLLNTLIAKTQKYSSIYSSRLKGRNNFTNDSMASAFIPDSVMKTGFTTKSLMGKDTPAPANLGGATKTIPLYSNAYAIGKGIKAGYYKHDTTISDAYIEKATLYMPAYHNGTAWISAGSGLPVPLDMPVIELNYDQRGKIRNDPPCAGAFEFTADDTVAAGRRIAKNPIIENFYIAQGRICIVSPIRTVARISIFNLAGAILFSCSKEINAGANSTDLPIKTSSIAICKITFPGDAVVCKRVLIR